MRSLLNISAVLAVLCCLAACGKDAERKTYLLSGTLWQDSLSDAEVVLYVGHQGAFEQQVVPVVNGAFSFQGESADMSEITLVYGRHTAHLYAAPGAEIVVQLDSAGSVVWDGQDSINGWLASHEQVLSTMSSAKTRKYVDSVCHLSTGSIRSTLLLREQMQRLNDSLFVRRCLGSLSDEAKPAWLMRAFNEQFDRLSTKVNRNYRLPRAAMRLANDSVFNLLDSRQESLLIFFWADYDSASIDSLVLLNGIARDYGLYDFEENFEKEKSPTRSKKMHKLALMTVCLHASDSAAWHSVVDSLPGMHSWIEGGFAHPLLTAFDINDVPANLQADRFSNMQSINKWGKPLVTWLEGTPAKVTKVKQLNKR